jgi:hypothetical protein
MAAMIRMEYAHTVPQGIQEFSQYRIFLSTGRKKRNEVCFICDAENERQ